MKFADIKKKYKNMQKIIFVTKYYCELCKKELNVHLYGEYDSIFTQDEEPEVIEWARHFHWIDNHRVCAVCGNLVKPGELELLVNEGRLRIHKDYTDEYMKVDRDNKFGHLLIVHESCMHKYGKQTNNQ